MSWLFGRGTAPSPAAGSAPSLPAGTPSESSDAESSDADGSDTESAEKASEGEDSDSEPAKAEVLMRKLEGIYPNAAKFLSLLDKMPMPPPTVNPLSYLVTAHVIRKAVWSRAKIDNLLPEFRSLQDVIGNSVYGDEGFTNVDEAFERFQAAAAETELHPDAVQSLQDEFNSIKLRTKASDQPLLEFLDRNVKNWEL